MPRQRERFERTDVPRDNPYRNIIALVVVVASLVVVVLVCLTLWARVQREVRLGDNDLEDAISGVSVASRIDWAHRIRWTPSTRCWFLRPALSADLAARSRGPTRSS